MLSSGQWINEPPSWHVDQQTLTATSGKDTDFWRETHYGFVRDNGHFLALAAPESFTAEVEVSGDFRELYDQAGLMLRCSATRWVKAGAEFTDDALRLSTVVTDEHSDWSVSRPLGGLSFAIRFSLHRNALRIQARCPGRSWELIRLAPFAAAAEMTVGPMFCTPKRAGLTARFEGFRLGPPLTTDLHDNS